MTPWRRMFGGMFGGGFGGGQEEEEQIPKGADVYVELEASLEELYLGATITVSHQSVTRTMCYPAGTLAVLLAAAMALGRLVSWSRGRRGCLSLQSLVCWTPLWHPRLASTAGSAPHSLLLRLEASRTVAPLQQARQDL